MSDDKMLYPVGYKKPKETPESPPDPATVGRDLDAAKALIKAAVPEGGNPMAAGQLVELVLGTIITNPAVQTVVVARVDDDQSAAIEAVRGHRPSEVIRGPAACSSLHEREVRALIDEVIEERRPTWDLGTEAQVEPMGGVGGQDGKVIG